MATIDDAVWTLYAELRDKPGEHQWDEYDAFIAETSKTHGEDSLEVAHALAIFGRKSRWESARGDVAVAHLNRAVTIALRDPDVPDRLGYWYALLCVISDDLGHSEEATAAAERSLEAWRRASTTPVYLKSREAILIAVRLGIAGTPVVPQLRELALLWPEVEEGHRDEQAGVIRRQHRAPPVWWAVGPD